MIENRSAPGAVVPYLCVEDVDRHHDHAPVRGARVLLGPETDAFGERRYSVEDFAGRLWTFSQSVADVAQEEWGARVREDA